MVPQVAQKPVLHLAPSPSVPCYTGATQQVWALPRLVYLRSLGLSRPPVLAAAGTDDCASGRGAAAT